MSWPALYAVAAALCSGLLYVIVWRLPIRFSFAEKWQEIFWGSVTAVAIIALYAAALPRLYLWLPHRLASGELLILRSDFWVLALPGFFQAVFCFIPLVGWFDEETRNRPAFQQRNTKGLLFCAFLFAVLPQYFALNAYTSFGDGNVERVGYWSPVPERIDYAEISSLEIDSERRTSSGKGGPRSYSVLLIHIQLKDAARRTVLETEDPDAALASVLARVILHLRTRGIEAKVPFLLTGQEKWKHLLEEHLTGAQ